VYVTGDDLLPTENNDCCDELVTQLSCYLTQTDFQSVLEESRTDPYVYRYKETFVDTLITILEERYGRITILKTCVAMDAFWKIHVSSVRPEPPCPDCLRIYGSYLTRNLVGCGKGKRMIHKGVLEKGSGSKSKKSDPIRPPLSLSAADERGVKGEEKSLSGSDDSDSEEDPDELGKKFKNRLIRTFVPSARPNTKITFDFNEIFVTNRNGVVNMRKEKFFAIDCKGSPFCGLVCIDHAAGVNVSVKDYIEKMPTNCPSSMGTVPWLNSYAAHRGLNLAIIVDNRVQHFRNNPGWKYVCLQYQAPGIDDLYGHWLLVGAEPLNSAYRHDINSYLNDDERLPIFWLMVFCFQLALLLWVLTTFGWSYFVILGLLINVYLVSFWPQSGESMRVIEEWTNIDPKDDKRLTVEKRDAIEDEDVYCRVASYYRFFGFNVWKKGELVISKLRFLHVMREAEALPSGLVGPGDRLKALSVMTRLRGINSELFPHLILNTRHVCIFAINKMKSCRFSIKVEKKAYNCSSYSAVIPNLNLVENNQIQGIAGCGVNHIRNCRVNVIKNYREVGHGGVLSIVSFDKQVGIGKVPVTDDLNLISAFAGRSMSKDSQSLDKDVLSDFCIWAKNEIDKLIKTTDIVDIESDAVTVFRRRYAGKIKKEQIDEICNNFENLSGYCSKKFFQCSAFVKLENSSKCVKGTWMNRPRLIMIMSDFMKVSLCPLLELIEAWNHGPISDFQCKGLTPEEFVDKVCYHTGVSHLVTDYSAFESSIFGSIRQLENYCLMALAVKSGNDHLKSLIKKFLVPVRQLKTTAGTFVNNSRNSGDFQTSMGNGLINYLLAKYNWVRNGSVGCFRMLAEGDDGIIEKTALNVQRLQKLGFSFSSELCGSVCGDVDFLRCRWMDGLRFMNIGRAFKLIWTLKNKQLKQTDVKAIQRCAAYCLHLASPGHPVLGALVVRIGMETSGINLSKTAIDYMENQWNFDDRALSIQNFPKKFVVNEEMRGPIACGAAGFPPLSISCQISLENALLNEPIPQVGGMLDHYEDFRSLLDQECFGYNYSYVLNKDLKALLKILHD
jgi:hypothetical protein